jgi:hypothetical protein
MRRFVISVPSGVAMRANNERRTEMTNVAASRAAITTAAIGRRKKRKKCLANLTAWRTGGG